MSATVHFFHHRSYLDIILISPSSRRTRYVNRGSSRSVTLNCKDLSQVRPASCMECRMGHWFQLTSNSFPGQYLFGTLDFMTNENAPMSGSCLAHLFYNTCNPTWDSGFLKHPTPRMSSRVYLCGALVSPHQQPLCH
jgi:hypothetical protein